ncbi:MAG: hypothetical protein PHN89_00580 [Candidatus Pacebacteria bacterium]|nr:hypothetical protein [Candidatus Paceibacterota bacterium]
MFIASYPNGKMVTEKDMVWDKVPGGMQRLEITLPIPVIYTDKQGLTKKAPDRTISLGRYDRYYFFNEAVASLGDRDQAIKSNLVAKVIAGIDDKKEMVVEIRVDRGGFASVKSYPLSEMTVIRGIKKGA